MGDVDKERYIYQKMLNCHNVIGDTAQMLHNFLREKSNKADFKKERPDIIIVDEEVVIGIEHCMVDVLFKSKHTREHSLVRQRDGKIKSAVNTYKEKPVLLDEDIKSGKAPGILRDLIQDEFNYRERFDYQRYVKFFNRVTKEHSDNCSIYRANIKEYVKKIDKSDFLVCLIEVQCPAVREYKVIDRRGKVYKQRITGIPVTSDILNSISQMKGFDFVILFLNTENGKDKIYYFVPWKMKQCIEEQHISIYSMFDLVNKYHVDVSGECGIDSYDMSFDVRLKP